MRVDPETRGWSLAPERTLWITGCLVLVMVPHAVRIPAWVTIPAGAASTTVDLIPRDDIYGETPETATLTLLRYATYTVDAEHQAATVTIADDEPVVGIEATDPTAAEPGDDAGQFTITRDGDTAAPLRVRCRITGTARHGRDYERISAWVTIQAGAASATIDIVPRDDTHGEAPEAVTLIVLPYATYSVDPGLATATVTLVDDEPTVSIEATDAAAAESGEDPGQFTITRDGDASAPLTVWYRISGTARNRLDYAWLPTWAIIPAGEASATIDVAPVADWYAESPETVVVTLLPNTAYAVSSSLPAATVTIADEP